MTTKGLGSPRCYTHEFCKKLMDCYQGRVTAQPSLRSRKEIDPAATDRMIFSAMPLGDPCIDAGLPKVWKYIFSNKYLAIPDSWVECIAEFDRELTQAAQ